MRSIFCLLLMYMTHVNLNAQIITRRGTQEINNEIHKLIPSEKGRIVDLPKLDNNRLQNLSNRNVNDPFQFGEAIDVKINLDDGQWYEDKNKRRWKLTILSSGAFSLNLIFDKLSLVDEAELYIYDEDLTTLMGPITSKNSSKNDKFWTDLVPGSVMILELIEPNETKEKSQISIGKVIHGFIDTFSSGSGSSAPCNVDINCPQGLAFQTESNAIARLIVNNGQSFCSGALINNSCNDLTPNLLTAFHCMDTNSDGVLSIAERNDAQNWVFRFEYKSPTPVCDESGNGGNTAVNISYNGSTFRAGHSNTDFILVELNQALNHNNVSLLGWSRNITQISSTASIHHPRGDLMKISIDNNSPSIVSWGNGTNTHWRSHFNVGTVEFGSSGSPLLDYNKRIIGQLHGDQNNQCGSIPNNTCFCNQRIGEYGRFDLSWNGGGTPQTRLRDWLDPSNSNTMITNTISKPSLTGPTLVCTSNSTFTLSNVPAGASVSWTRSSNLNQVEANNSSITVKAANSNSSGNGWVRATITTDCGSYDVQQDFWVDKANVDSVSFSNGVGQSGYFCSSHNGNFYSIFPKQTGVTHQIRLKQYPNLNIV